MDRVRFHRQLVLAEIGEAGQWRIAEATAAVPAHGLAREVGTLYAERAGFGNVVPMGDPTAEPTVPEWVQDGSARAIVAGSLAVVAAMREVTR